MGRTVSELRASLRGDEYADWLAFDRIFPVGDWKIDAMIAHLCTIVCGVAGAKKRGGGPFTIDDFQLWKLPNPQTPREMMQRVFGARVIKGKPKRAKNGVTR